MSDPPPKGAAGYGRLARIFANAGEWLKRLFPERQIYVRSEGRIGYYILGSRMQVAASCIGALFLAWAAFVTVNVVFKDRIIAAKDYRFQRRQSAYEDRLAGMRISYDELVAKAADAQQDADRRALVLSHKQKEFGGASNATSIPAILPSKRAAAAQFGKCRRGSGFIDQMLERLGWRRPDCPPLQYHPSLVAIGRDAILLQHLGDTATGMMVTMEARSHKAVDARWQIIQDTGINVEQFLRRLGAAEGMGGPEIPLDDIKLDGISDRAFTLAYLKAEADLGELVSLRQAVGRLPTAIPLAGKINLTSGFGPRIDPFTGRYGFHTGVDLAATSGTPVLATADGQVVFAGSGGSYGNMVLLDHGFGLRTRYAHLMTIAVTVGQRVRKGMPVGRLGSTGRSTGPHLHYEVLYDNFAHNPAKFFGIAGTH